MAELMTYQRYTYDPKRGHHNLYDPLDLEEIKEVDKFFNYRPKGDHEKELARQHRYYFKNHDKIIERERLRREARRKQMEAAK